MLIIGSDKCQEFSISSALIVLYTRLIRFMDFRLRVSGVPIPYSGRSTFFLETFCDYFYG